MMDTAFHYGPLTNPIGVDAVATRGAFQLLDMACARRVRTRFNGDLPAFNGGHFIIVERTFVRRTPTP